MNACPKPAPGRRVTRWRRATQAFFALLFLVLPFGAAHGFTWIAGTLGALQIGPVNLVEPAGALAALLGRGRLTWALMSGALLLTALAVALGPVFCSWVCPWSLISEGVDGLRSRRPARRWSGRDTRAVTRVRRWTLAGVLFASFALATPLAALISGPRLITTLPLELLHVRHLSWVTGGLLLGLLVLEVSGPRRLWCRALCPAGAVAKAVRTRWTLRPVYDAARCADPRVALCLVECPWGIDPRALRLADGCTTCMACLDACGTGALTARFGHAGIAEGAAFASEGRHG